MSVFPDHCVKRPSSEAMITRRRIPAVRTRSSQDCLLFSSSILMVDWICAISARAKSECGSPSAWYLTKMARASSCLSRLMRKRGDSGMKLRGLVSLGDCMARLRSLQDESNLQSRRDRLKQRWNPPCPVRRNLLSAKGDAGGKNGANKPAGIEHGRQDGTLLRIAQLAHERRGCNNTEGDAEAQQKPRCQVHTH